MRRWRLGLTVALVMVFALAGWTWMQAPSDPMQTQTADQDQRDENGESDPHNPFLSEQPNAFSTGVSTGSEPRIMAHPNGDYLLVGDTAGVYRSSDGGHSWESTTPSHFFALADGVSLARDDAGNVYAAAMNGPSILTARSEDGGQTWEPGAVIDDVAPIADRPWIAAHGDGRVALLYYDFGRTLQEYCLASTDGAQTFPDRTLVQRAVPGAGPATFSSGGSIGWAVEGTVYLRSPQTVAGQPLLCDQPVDSRTLISDPGPQVFTELSNQGSNAWIATPSEDSSQLEVASTSQTSFSLVPTDGEDRLRTNTFMMLSGTEDELAIAWYGSASDGDPTSSSFSGAWNVYVAQIQAPANQSGQTLTCESAAVSCHRITEEPNYVGQICMDGIACNGNRELLDYFGVDHGLGDTVHVAFADSGGAADRETRYACLGEDCPSPSAQVDIATSCPYLDCTFEATTEGFADEASLSYDWSLGDGETATGPEVNHSYDERGTYTVELAVSDGDLTATAQKTIHVEPEMDLQLAPSQPQYGIQEDIRLHANVTAALDGRAIANVTVDVVTWLETDNDLADGFLSAPITKSALTTADVAYHERSAVTDEDGHAIIHIPGEAEDTGHRINVPTGPGEYKAGASIPLDGVFATSRTSYHVGPLG